LSLSLSLTARTVRVLNSQTYAKKAQQPTTTNNNQQQPTTTNNNQQQPTTNNRSSSFPIRVWHTIDLGAKDLSPLGYIAALTGDLPVIPET
jgi:hypothetical protein